MIQPGDKLYGYCGGLFGRDSYSDKIVIATGNGFVLAREIDPGVPGATGVVLATDADIHVALGGYLRPEEDSE